VVWLPGATACPTISGSSALQPGERGGVESLRLLQHREVDGVVNAVRFRVRHRHLQGLAGFRGRLEGRQVLHALDVVAVRHDGGWRHQSQRHEHTDRANPLPARVLPPARSRTFGEARWRMRCPNDRAGHEAACRWCYSTSVGRGKASPSWRRAASQRCGSAVLTTSSAMRMVDAQRYRSTAVERDRRRCCARLQRTSAVWSRSCSLLDRLSMQPRRSPRSERDYVHVRSVAVSRLASSPCRAVRNWSGSATRPRIAGPARSRPPQHADAGQGISTRHDAARGDASRHTPAILPG